jgi:hypothetical protein
MIKAHVYGNKVTSDLVQNLVLMHVNCINQRQLKNKRWKFRDMIFAYNSKIEIRLQSTLTAQTPIINKRLIR